MSLKLRLKPHERFVVNGCIMRNGTNRRIEIEIENQSDVLRGSEMLDAVTANTPVKRICYLVQIALVSRSHREDALQDIRHRISELRDVMSVSHGEAIDNVMAMIDAGEFYLANRKLQEIVAYEAMLLNVPASPALLAAPAHEGRVTEDVT